MLKVLMLLPLALACSWPALASDSAPSSTEASTADAALSPSFSPSAQTPLDLDRYMGRWYVIARSPNPVERGHIGSINEYERDDDNGVRVRYLYRDQFHGDQQVMELKATPLERDGYRRWRNWFYKIVPTRTDILEVANDYSWAIIAYPGRDMGWIVSRTPDMDSATYRLLLDKLRDHDIRTDRMRRVVHAPAHLDQLGFEAPPQR